MPAGFTYFQLVTRNNMKSLTTETALDITENPRHLQIMELEGAQLPRVLDDPLSLIHIFAQEAFFVSLL